MVRSPRQRILAWVVLWRRFHGEAFDDAVLSRDGQVRRGGQSRRDPEQLSERIGEELDVPVMTFVHPGVVGGVGGAGVVRQQAAVAFARIVLIAS